MIMANGIKVKLVMSCGFRAPQHNPSPNRDIKDFSGEDYDTANGVNCIITFMFNYKVYPQNIDCDYISMF